MGIDTGLNLSYNQNFPTPNVNQPSQQFRDNFSVIKSALELFQAATNSSESIFDLNVNQNVDGIITIDANYTGNSLMLPVGDPTVSSSSGMIKYHSTSSSIQFYDGTGWRKLVNQDSSGNVNLSDLTVTNRITTTNLTINSDPTVGTDAVRLSYLNTSLANILVSGGYASYDQILAETMARSEEDIAIRAEIATINNNITNSVLTVSSINSQISDLSNAITAETRFRSLADTNQLGLISNCIQTTGGTMTGDLLVNQANVSINDGSLTLSNSALYLPQSNLTLDSGKYLLFNAIPNLIGGNDGGFITYDQNNFSYARLDSGVSAAVAADIAANGIAAANTHWEVSCLRIGTTNDPSNGLNNDSIALEPAADLWLNPGWAGGGVTNTGTGNPDLNRVAITGNASVYVGNATTWTIKMIRATGDIITNGAITAAGDISGLSDASLKDNVRTIENSLDKIDKLRGVLYTRNDLHGNPEQIGLIAQEVKETIPQVVHETENGLLSVSYGNLVALLIEGIKDLRAEIEDIKKKIN